MITKTHFGPRGSFMYITRILFAASCVAALVGCSKQSFEVGEVDGVVLIQGKPAANIFVQFIPEVSGEDSPPPSNGRTDDQGHFTLQIIEANGSSQPGAAVGGHRIILRDLAAAESRSAPRRLPSQYNLATATPLTQEVKPGTQTVEIHVPPR
jgi:hypothetical protein